MSKRAPDINARHRETEKSVNVSVIADEPGNSECERCRERGLCFQVHLFRQSKVERLCKPCTIGVAHGEEKVWVRTGEALRKKWRDGRGQQPDHLRSALIKRRSERVQSPGV